ncbi:MFS transporter [Rubrobacter taiwanensis]|jgi:predicted MFS family arabinose efflux permease|uniref:MFS transporter n=1 Tax=Rubrobacter taiwanensis TaxID=185139 RepID=A0A4R1BFF1_9ACTN|nr:MFS transporter [Rubrobacter taiwanensis]TCJ15880.1 MFS transporter [Rubrobacter taiwanensis]
MPDRAQKVSPAARLFLTALAAFSGGFLLLSVVPLYAARPDGGGPAAGLATGAFMLSTVSAQLAMPWLLPRTGYRTAMALGLIFLGLPAFLYLWTQSLASLLAVTLVRGLGFGIVTVVGSAAVADLFPAGRRGEGIGLYGIAVGLPALFCLPLGVWLAGAAGFGPVFLLGAAAPLLGLLAAAGISIRTPEARTGNGHVLRGMGRRALLLPTATFTSVTIAAGVVITFLPLAASGTGSAAAGLFCMGAASTAARWWAGRFGDRHGPQRLLLPGLLVASAGMLILALSGASATALAGGALLFGAGYGTMQNATLAVMFDRVPPGEYGLASTLWNVAFDAGTGLGAASFGFIVEAAGFGPAFALSAALMILATGAVRLDAPHGRAAGSRRSPGRSQ